jgi:hypothetical protein
MAKSLGARIFGFVVLSACVVVLAGGAWFFFGRDLFPSPDDVASDDEPDEITFDRDGGVHRVPHPGKRRGKKGGGVGKKGSTGIHAAGAEGPAGRSYEAAIAGSHQDVTIGGAAGAPDLTDAQLGGPMRNGLFLSTCGAPNSMHVTVKVAVRSGRAVGVSVYTTPPDAHIAGCVDRAVRNLAWPVSGKMDSFVTNY